MVNGTLGIAKHVGQADILQKLPCYCCYYEIKKIVLLWSMAILWNVLAS